MDTDENLFRLVLVPGHGARVLPLELVPVPGHGAQISARASTKGFVQTGARARAERPLSAILVKKNSVKTAKRQGTGKMTSYV